MEEQNREILSGGSVMVRRLVSRRGGEGYVLQSGKEVDGSFFPG
jgi:hypothetical protein